MPFLSIFSVPNMSFNAIRKNKILAKISRFTVVGQKNSWEDKDDNLTVS